MFQRDYTISLKNLSITNHDLDFISSFNYEVYNEKLIYLDFTLKQLVTEFDVNFSFDMIKKDNRRMNIFRMNMDGCEILASAHDKMNFLKVIFREMFRVSNIPKKCPVPTVRLTCSML